MGQKTNPIGFRLGINKDWDSTWFDEKNYSEKIKEDAILRSFINNKLSNANISKIKIARTAKNVTINIFTARPGIVIGKGGSEVEALKSQLKKQMGYEVQINVSEIKQPALKAELVGQSISQQLLKKVNYRRAVKKAIQTGISMGALGVKITISGRLNGIEIARAETFKEGRIPLHTLRADIDYAMVHARTTYGVIGIKVWIYMGDKLLGDDKDVIS